MKSNSTVFMLVSVRSDRYYRDSIFDTTLMVVVIQQVSNNFHKTISVDTLN